MNAIAYYNEIDPKAAAWLRELISAGHIAPGIVDERSIEDVTPNDLRGFTQCHFFAGIGVWSHALRLAGWPDDRPIWTMSCPCQPFSAAGQRKGTGDERHLWPSAFWLIEQCRPSIILGEQVAQKAGAAWFDLVSNDLEGEGYACGTCVFPACGIGAPHLRQRQYWTGHLPSAGLSQRHGGKVPQSREVERPERSGSLVELANGDGLRLKRERGSRKEGVTEHCEAGGMADPKSSGRRVHNSSNFGETHAPSDAPPDPSDCAADRQERSAAEWSGPTNGFWGNVDWLHCRDGKWRPVEPGSFPLVDGSPERVGRLRGYGNAIVAPQAKAFIEVVKEILTEIK